MDGWKITDIAISVIQLLAVSSLTYSHRLKNHGGSVPTSMYVLFAVRLALSCALFACVVKLAVSNVWTNVVLCLLQLSTNYTEWAVLVRLYKSLPNHAAVIFRWMRWPSLALKVVYVFWWLHPWLRIAISATHVLDDLAFLVAYSLLQQKGARNVFMTMRSLYFLGLLVAMASVIISSIQISHRLSIRNSLFLAHLLMQTFSIAGTLFDWLNKNRRELQPQGLQSQKRSTERLVSGRSFIAYLDSAPVLHSQSLPSLPPPAHPRPSPPTIARYPIERAADPEARDVTHVHHFNCQPLRIVSQPTQGFYTVSVADKSIRVSATALKTSKAGKILLWVYGELPIRSIFKTLPHSAEAFRITGRAPASLSEDDVYIISGDKGRISVPVGAVNATHVGRILSREFETSGLFWGASWLVYMSLLEEMVRR